MQKRDLHRTIESIVHRSGLSEPMAFLYWFLRARFGILTDNEVRASICDGTSDKGIDAVHVDHAARIVFVVQSKYTKTFGAGHIERDDIKKLCATKRFFTDTQELNKAVRGAKEDTKKHLRTAFQLVHADKFVLSFVIASTRQQPRNRIDDILEDYGIQEEKFQVFALSDTVRLRAEELRGQAPPTPTFELEYDRSYSLLKVARPQMPAISWTVVVTAGELRRIVTSYGDQIFRKNVRGFLGENKISKDVVATLSDNPENFWFFNNGVTILADRVHEVAEANKLRLENAHVVNGCQTMKTLYRAPLLKPQLRKALLPVRVIVPRDLGNAQSFISGTIIAQNSTNPIRPRDLRSNDPLQVGLQMAFKERGYYLEIKRGYEFQHLSTASKKEFRYKAITNEQLALAYIAATKPDDAKAHKAELFEKPFYNEAFAEGIPVDEYLLRYYLLNATVQSYRGRGGKFHDLTIRTFKPHARLHAFFVLVSSVEITSPYDSETTHRQVVLTAEKEATTYGGVGFLDRLRKPADIAFEVCYEAYVRGQNLLEKGAGEAEDTVEITPGNFFIRKESTALVKQLMRARRKEMSRTLASFWKTVENLQLQNIAAS